MSRLDAALRRAGALPDGPAPDLPRLVPRRDDRNAIEGAPSAASGVAAQPPVPAQPAPQMAAPHIAAPAAVVPGPTVVSIPTVVPPATVPPLSAAPIVPRRHVVAPPKPAAPP